MKMKLERLRLLVSQACRCIHETEVEIKYIEGLEIQRANKAYILKAVHALQRVLEHQLCRRQTAVQDPVIIPDDTDKSDKEAMMQMAGLGPDDQEPLIPSVKHIGYKLANLGNAKNAGGVNMTESGVSANKTGEYMDESMEVEDRVRAPDAVTTKSLDISVGGLGGVGGLGSASKIAETDAVTAKSSDVSIRGLRGASKIAETDVVTTKN